MPYLNLSGKVYYIITCSFYALMVIMAHYFGRSIYLDTIDKVSSAIVPTAIIYLCAGHFYHMASI